MPFLGENERKIRMLEAGHIREEIIRTLSSASASLSDLADKTRLKKADLALGLDRLLRNKEVDFTARRTKIIWFRKQRSDSNPQI